MSQSTRILLQGHRGDPKRFPENGIDGFLNCAAQQIPAIELDVLVSKDLKLIVLHDPHLNPEILETEGLEKTVFSLNSIELQELSYTKISKSQILKFPKVPTLDKVLITVADFCDKNSLPIPRFTIELKSEPKQYNQSFPQPKQYAAILEDCLSKFKRIEYKIQSFDPELLKEVSKISEADLILLIFKNIELSHLKDIISNSKLQGIGALYKIIDTKSVREWRSLGLEISAWTVDEEDEMFRLIELGVRNIISNCAIEMRQLLKDKGFEVY